MQTENDTSKPEDSPKQETGEGCSGATCSTFLLSDWKPEYSIQFRATDNSEVGKLEWTDGILKFTGNIDESAKVFLRYLATLGGLQIDLSNKLL